MSTVQVQALYTPDDLLAMPDGKNYELVDGELVELNVSALSSLVGATLSRELGNFCQTNNLAWVFGADCGYQGFPSHSNKVRKPDVSVVLHERLPAEQLEGGFLAIPPGLAVEVVSPKDSAYEVEVKIPEYLEVGVRLIWVVYPPTRTLHVHRADGSIVWLREDDELSGEDILPGFRCRVGDLFQAQPAASQPTA